MAINQKCKLTVPAKDLILFQVVANDNCNKHIDIDTVNYGGKSVERMKTPEIVEKDVEEYKQNQKKKYFEQAEKGTIIMKDNLSDILLNHHNNQLFDTKQYSIYNNIHQTNVVLMTGCTDITEQQANELITELCPRFAEFVVVLDGYWFFCTSFCTFIHSRSVDDCADSSLVNAQNEPVSYIRKKTRKGDMLKKHALYLWSKQVGSSVLMEKLEAISCQWQRTKFTIYGSRALPSDTMLIYKKGSYSFPISSRHSPEFSKLLLAIFSLKRTVKFNYAKFNLILEEKYKNEVKTLNFADDIFNEVSFRSNSTDSDGEYDDGCHEENEPEDEEFVGNTKVMLDGLKEDEKGLKRFHDLEDMLLFDCSKRRKTRNY